MLLLPEPFTVGSTHNRSLALVLYKMLVPNHSWKKNAQWGVMKAVNAIFIVRQIMKKAKEHQAPLHLNFVEFKAVFDNIWRGALWKMLRSFGVDPKITSLTEAMYDNVEYAVIISGQLKEWI